MGRGIGLEEVVVSSRPSVPRRSRARRSGGKRLSVGASYGLWPRVPMLRVWRPGTVWSEVPGSDVVICLVVVPPSCYKCCSAHTGSCSAEVSSPSDSSTVLLLLLLPLPLGAARFWQYDSWL
ncbi:hypothetical protein K431DRAFT_65766 [Polychaeton citri CBS 116435]|uniref:Uncharacterized protein n=1 Tax=Polychaeton citri CBS 116435 TaxID=1314669 RepID=A0A9P4UR33_9PEZI|nr:hypothetical protein K431DRAFT_65766 [Polychaeton citri CBS 116435]